jgi:hypothetical protein
MATAESNTWIESGNMTNEPTNATGEPGLDTLQPLSGWWMYEVEDAGVLGAREAKKWHLEDEMEEFSE